MNENHTSTIDLSKFLQITSSSAPSYGIAKRGDLGTVTRKQRRAVTLLYETVNLLHALQNPAPIDVVRTIVSSDSVDRAIGVLAAEGLGQTRDRRLGSYARVVPAKKIVPMKRPKWASRPRGYRWWLPWLQVRLGVFPDGLWGPRTDYAFWMRFPRFLRPERHRR